ncbi:MAG: hypothetical protein KIT09_17010 [Bryobacteraceae bacterium]|nr:hypothetical protein [Bryobacteraceae bacterium]
MSLRATCFFVALLLIAPSVEAESGLFDFQPGSGKQSRILIDAGARAERPVTRRLFGKFTEHLWWNVYQGLWAQNLRNPSFESWELMGEGSGRVFSWTTQNGFRERFPHLRIEKTPRLDVAPWWAPWGDGKATYALDPNAFNSERCQRITAADVSGGAGVEQPVFLPLHRERTYDLAFQARGNAALRVSVQAPDRELAAASVAVQSADWRRYPVTLALGGDKSRGLPLLLRIELTSPGDVWLDQATMFPRDNVEGFDPDVVRLLRESRLPLLRFPGGNFVSGYHWEDGVGPVETRPTRRNPAWGDFEPNHVGTDEYLALCRLVGCEPMICVNAGNGSAREAANWVEYCNGAAGTKFGAMRAANGHPEPYNVKLWEIGNELYGDWQIGHCTAEEYAERYAAFYAAMSRIDPGIHFFAIGQNPKWSTPLLKAHPSIVRTLTMHELPGGSIDPGAPPVRVFEELMAYPLALRERMFSLAALMRDEGVKPSFAVTEAQIFTRKQSLPNNSSLAEALFLAGLIHMSIREGDLVEMITHSALVNHGGGLRKQREIVFATPVHYASLLYGTQSGAYPARIELQAPEYRSPGNYLPETKDLPTPVLDPVALLNDRGDELTLIVINRSPKDALTAAIELRGFAAAGPVSVRTVTGDNYMTRNEADAPERVRIIRASAEQRGGALSYAFPPHSLVELAFRRAE